MRHVLQQISPAPSRRWVDAEVTAFDDQNWVPDEKPIDIKQVARNLARGWWAGVIVFLITMGIGVVGVLRHEVTYRVDAVLALELAVPDQSQLGQAPSVVSAIAADAKVPATWDELARESGGKYTAEGIANRVTAVQNQDPQYLLYLTIEVSGTDLTETKMLAESVAQAYAKHGSTVVGSWFGASMSVIFGPNLAASTGGRNFGIIPVSMLAILAGLGSAAVASALLEKKDRLGSPSGPIVG